MGGGVAASCSALYFIYVLTAYDYLLPSEPFGGFKVVFALSLTAPFRIVFLLACDSNLVCVLSLDCLLVCAFVVNATVPFVLLRCERRGLKRDAVAALDIALDLVYFLIFRISMAFVQAWPTLLPVAP